MLRYLLLTALVLGLSACNNSSEQSSATDENPAETAKSAKLENIGLASPESVNSDGTFFYVSNVGPELKPMDKDGDGFISKLDAEGNVVAEKFISGLDAPKGSAIVNGKIFVADVDKVKAFNLSDGSAAEIIDFGSYGTAFLNDIVAKDNGEMFVSATDIGKVFSVNPADLSVAEITTDVPVAGPNGLWWDGANNRLLIASYTGSIDGKVCAIDFKPEGNQYHPINDFGGFLDGIAITADGKLIFSDWNSAGVQAVGMPEGTASKVSMPVDSIKGPADFYYDAAHNTLWVPAMQENAIYIQSL